MGGPRELVIASEVLLGAEPLSVGFQLLLFQLCLLHGNSKSSIAGTARRIKRCPFHLGFNSKLIFICPNIDRLKVNPFNRGGIVRLLNEGRVVASVINLLGVINLQFNVVRTYDHFLSLREILCLVALFVRLLLDIDALGTI